MFGDREAAASETMPHPACQMNASESMPAIPSEDTAIGRDTHLRECFLETLLLEVPRMTATGI